MNVLIFLIIFGIIYFVIFASPKRPERAVYGYLLTWLLFPKFIHALPVFGSLPWEGVRWYDLINGVTGLTLIGSFLLARRSKRSRKFNDLSALLIWFVAMVLVSGVGFLLVDLKPVMATGVLGIQVARPYLEIVYTFLFALACMRSIDTFAKAEVLMALMVVSGLGLLFEFIFLYYLNLIPFFRIWTLDSAGTGRFSSISFLSFDSVGLITIVNYCFAGYFLVSRRVMGRWLLMPLIAFPVIGTLAKTPLTALVVATVTGLCLGIRNNRRIILSTGILIILVVFYSQAALISILPNLMNEYFGGAVRSDYSDFGSLIARFGLWVRAGDLFVDSFPFGVGAGQVQFAMGGYAPALFGQILTGPVGFFYLGITQHVHTTNTHNGFLETIVEHGLLGFCLIFLTGRYLVKLFRRFMDYRPNLRDEFSRRIFLAQVALFSALAGMSWRYMFEANDRYYHLGFMIIFLLALLPRLAEDSRRWKG